jgi:hypothetical protein
VLASAEFANRVNAGAGAYAGAWVREIATGGAASASMYAEFPAVPGETLIVDAQVKRTAGGGNGYVFIIARNGAGSGVGSASGNAVTSGSWALSTVSLLVPATAVLVQAYFWVDRVTTDTTCQFDAVSVRRMISAGDIVADSLRTSNYVQDGSGNPTAGAKLDHTGTALKVAPGNLQLGTRLLSAFGTAAVMGQVSATGGAPSVTGLNLASAAYWNAGLGSNSGLEITFTNALKGTTPPVVAIIPLCVSTHANFAWGYVSGVGSANAWTGVKLVAIDAPAAGGNAGWVDDLTAAWWGIEITCMDGWS